MLNIRKRFFLLLTIIGVLFTFTACVAADDVVRVSFDKHEYVVKVGQELDITPIIEKGSNVEKVTIEYSSTDSEIATFVDGKLTGLQEGVTEIKIVCSEKPIAFDVATVKVIKNELPRVEFVEPQHSMIKGTTQALQYSFVPDYASANMSFSSANPEVATVDENGVISAIKAGSAVIIARATDVNDPSEYQDYVFNIEVLEADFAITYVLNEGVNNPDNPAGYNVLTLPLELLAPTREAYRFLGWYDNPDFNGEPISALAAGTRGDVTLYAKWELVIYSITYDLAGGENVAENPATYNIENLPLTLQPATKAGYKFAGWYHGDQLVTEIPAGTLGEYAVTAKWEIVEYSITYNLNGGAWQNLDGVVYPFGMDRATMVAEFVKDFNAHSGKTVQADGSDFFARSWMADGSSAGYKFLADPKNTEKWGWMLKYINDARIKAGKAVLAESDGQAEARGEIHNFLNACAPGEKGGNASFGCDYSGEAGDAFWIYTLNLPEVVVVNKYTIESAEIAIPSPVYKTGYKFLGWYNGETKVESIPTGSYGDLVLEAKWEIINYELNLDLNGGLWQLQADLTNASILETFKLTDYLQIASATGFEASLDNKLSGRWWSFVALRETGAPGLYEIVQIVAGSTKVTEEYDYVITWHSALQDAATKATLDKMLNNAATYVGQYVAFEGVPAEQTGDCEITATVYSKDSVVIVGGPKATYTVVDEIVLPTPVKAGCEFLGWFNGETKVEKISKGSTGNVSLVAKWYDPNAVLKVNAVLNGGKLPEGAVVEFVAKDGLAELPVPTQLGYTFLGWYSDEECTKEVKSVEAGLNEAPTVYASWSLNTYKITYVTNGGEFQKDSQTTIYATFDELVADFLADYATFYGIEAFTAAQFYGKAMKYSPYAFFLNAEMAEKWGWLNQHIVDVAANANYAGKANLVVSAGAANFNKYMTANLSAFLQQARLTAIAPLPMDFTNADCEELWAACPLKDIKVGIEAKYEYTVLELPLELATPFREDATFVGWYLNEDLKNGHVTKLDVEHVGDITLYARWSDSVIKFDTYQIEYELNGGQLPEGAPTSYVEEQGAQLVAPTQAGFEFLGWYLDAECTKAVSEIKATDKGDVKLYASWKAITYKVEFVVGEGKLPTETIYVGTYKDYEAMVDDFVKDFNAQSGKTVTRNSETNIVDFFARSWTGDGSLGYKFLTDPNYSEKWGWMLTLINEVRVANGKEAIVETTPQAEARGDIHNLLNACAPGEMGGNKDYGCDWSSEEVHGKVWDHVDLIVGVEKVVDLTYTVVELPVELPSPIAPEGYKFAGWYLNEELTGEPMNVIAKGTTGDLKVYAKYIDATTEVKGKIEYVLNGGELSQDAPTEYVQGVASPVTATASKVGYKFDGWFANEECTEPVTEIAATAYGTVKLYAKYTVLEYKVTFVGVAGLTEQTLSHGSLLPVPTVPGFEFLGWYANAECTGEPVTTATEEMTVYASLRQALNTFDASHLEITVGEGADYATLDAAIEAAPEYAVLKLAAGEYSLGVKLTKSVTIKGVSAAETTINVVANIYDNIAAETIVIDSATLIGVGANVAGIYFQPSSKAHYFAIRNSVITDMNTVYKGIVSVTAGVELTLENNEITKVGQFAVWVTKGFNKLNLIGNTIHTCGTISNGAAALFRMRDGEVVVRHNTFIGTTPAIDGYIEASTDVTSAVVEYNTFKGVEKFVHSNSSADVAINFNQNLYLDAEGNVLTSVPTQVTNGKAVADTEIATSAEDLEARWALVAPKEAQLYFMVGEGSIQDNFEELAKHDGYTTVLPLVELKGYYFLGWCLNEDLSDAPISTLTVTDKEVINLYAKYEKIPVYTITYETNGGTLGENPVTECLKGETVEITTTVEKAESFFAGWYTNAECTGEPVTKLSLKADATLYAKWAAYEYGKIEYELNGGTLPEGAPTQYVLTVGATLPVPTKDGHKFMGWYDNAECTGEAVEVISTEATGDFKFYALWQNVSTKYNVTYVLNGGNTQFSSREEMVSAFIADFKQYSGKSVESDGSNFFDRSWNADGSSAGYNFLTSETYSAKWGWVLDYLNSVRVKAGKAELAATDGQAEARGEIHNFLNAAGNGDKGGNASFGCDYSSAEVANGFWSYIEKEYKDEVGQQLLEAKYPYHSFLGWYDNAELTGEPVKVITSDCTLYAKWAKNEYTLTYVLNNNEATLTNTTVKFDALSEFDLETPTFESKYWKFNGWFLDEELTQSIGKIAALTEHDVTVYASWTEITGYTYNIVLNGGNLVTPSDEQLALIKADFLADYTKYYGSSSFNVWDGESAATTQKIINVFSQTNGKWNWLLDYWSHVNTNSYSGVANATAFQQVKEKGTVPNNYFMTVEVKNWYNGTQSSVYSGSLKSANYADPSVNNEIWPFYSQSEQTTYLNNKGEVTLPVPHMLAYDFAGWYTNPELTGEPVTVVNEETAGTFYAKWVEGKPVESITINNQVSEIKRYETLQLVWTLNPTDANVQEVVFESSNQDVATIDKDGLITAITDGKTTIKVTSLSQTGASAQFDLEVYTPDHFSLAYESESYVAENGTIKLLAEHIKRDGSKSELVWSSKTPEIATVDENGVVTGVKAGLATITVAVKDNAEVAQDFVVTVLPAEMSDALKEVVAAHESNAFLRWNLGIGAGVPAYYRDILGSVSKLLYNTPFVKNEQYYAAQAGNSTNHGGEIASLEFITVHYTGNMSYKSTAAANASYFSTSSSVSIHYVTGNDGIFYVLDEKYQAWHAGDSGSYASQPGGKFGWHATGVKVSENDPERPIWGVNADSMFTINGKATTVQVPTGSTAATQKVTESRWINDMGLAWKVVDGEYYMGGTWWCYSQVAEGRICSSGGNRNSIGIESCVNPESDLWLTWQKTAQLVADIMIRNNLDITRVVGHHFFSAKDCPQPLLENDLEIWKIFIEMVEHEYQKMTTFKDVNFQFKSNSQILSEDGRIYNQPAFSEIVTYTVTVGDQEITLATAVEGLYNKAK